MTAVDPAVPVSEPGAKGAAEAVEALARALFAHEQVARHESVEQRWNDTLDDADQDEYREMARAALDHLAAPTPEGAEGERENRDVETALIVTSLVAGRVSGPEAIAALDAQIGDLLAATADRARREGAVEAGERIAQAIEARRVPKRRDNTQGQIDFREALDLGARIARADRLETP